MQLATAENKQWGLFILLVYDSDENSGARLNGSSVSLHFQAGEIEWK